MQLQHSQISRTDDRILALDGWRGMAIVSVLIGHFVGRFAVPEVEWIGQAGVELFLVLSGRLMAEILIVRQRPVGWFLFRRASRIMPALVAYVGIVGLVLTIAGHGAEIWRSALGAVCLVHNFLPLSAASGWFEHTWSIAVEEHSYLLLAAMALLLRRNSAAIGTACLLLIALALANGSLLSAARPADSQFVFFRTDVRIASVLIGFLVFMRFRSDFGRLGPLFAFLSPFALALGLIIFAVTEIHWIRYGIATLCLAVGVASVEQSHAAFRRLFEMRAITWFGTISYSLYLVQQPLFGLAILGKLNALIGLPLAVAAAAWGYHRIEKPARAALNQSFDRWRLMRTTSTAHA
jgi:peptidoglycan/LPS O-acetylase OafA/YrhL